jgi:biopolymer transport protein ExbB
MVETLAVRFNEGGPFMWIILGVLAVACAVALERSIFYVFVCRTNGAKTVSLIAKAINEGKPREAEQITNRRKAPVDVLLATAVDRFRQGMSEQEIREGVEEAAIREVPKMSQRLNYLALFANIATLLGLLGTIAGLQVSFSSLAAVEASKKAGLLAQGISQAMNTTAFGLIVAVPCMTLYTILNNTQLRLTKDLDEAVVRLINYLKKART